MPHSAVSALKERKKVLRTFAGHDAGAYEVIDPKAQVGGLSRVKAPRSVGPTTGEGDAGGSSGGPLVPDDGTGDVAVPAPVVDESVPDSGAVAPDESPAPVELLSAAVPTVLEADVTVPSDTPEGPISEPRSTARTTTSSPEPTPRRRRG